MSSRLYLITPSRIPDPQSFRDTLKAALEAGDVACLQLRLKDCDDAAIGAAIETLMPVCHEHDVAFLLNDRPDLAAAFRCDGVHVGPDDMSYEEARRLVGESATVGVTCRDLRHLAMDLAEAGADYVAFGAFFPSTTKNASERPETEILSIWSETTNVPCVAIGGISVENCEPLVRAGADFLAVSAGVWNYADGPAAAVKAFNDVFERTTVEFSL